jgi:hypothetical protein
MEELDEEAQQPVPDQPAIGEAQTQALGGDAQSSV